MRDSRVSVCLSAVLSVSPAQSDIAALALLLLLLLLSPLPPLHRPPN